MINNNFVNKYDSKTCDELEQFITTISEYCAKSKGRFIWTKEKGLARATKS